VLTSLSPTTPTLIGLLLPSRTLSPSGFQALTGNQVGAILGWWAAERAKSAGGHGALANSIVSSPVLGKIASHFGLDHVETLTGFKYVSRVPDLIFGFEEALGYLVNPDVVRDKDGISAALAILDIADGLALKGLTLWDYLSDIRGGCGRLCLWSNHRQDRVFVRDVPLTDLVRRAAPQKIGALEVYHNR
jgi:phosphomannomutase